MNYTIHITSTAKRDINRAADHIEFDLKNPQAADKLLDEAERQVTVVFITDVPLYLSSPLNSHPHIYGIVLSLPHIQHRCYRSPSLLF